MAYALVTGASSGIGKELALELARKHYDIVLVARRKEKLLKVKKQIETIGQKCVAVPLDLTAKGACDKLFKGLAKEKISISILVNNAGFGDYALFKDADLAKMQNMITLNIVALTTLSHIFLPQLINNKGKILNVASVAAFGPGAMMAVYFATKAYVLSFSEAIAVEFEELGVRVTALCPGMTQSEFQHQADMEDAFTSAEFKKYPTSKEVAVYGVEALLRSQVVAVHGFANNMLVLGMRLLPRSIMRKQIYRQLKK